MNRMKRPKILNLRFLGLSFCENREIYGKIITLFVNKEIFFQINRGEKGVFVWYRPQARKGLRYLLA